MEPRDASAAPRAGRDAGDQAPAEDRLPRYPALRESHDAILDMIDQEFVIRRSRGESPDPVEYLRRFPTWSEGLAHQFEVDEAMRSASPLAIGSAEGEAATLPRSDSIAGGSGPHAPDAPPSIEGYDLIEELGRGGMGIVYKAIERRLNRVVAIKTISEAAFASPSQRRRFLAEAEVIARVRHPHIIPVHAVGEEQGRPYFSLEFAEGGSLAQRLARGPLSVRQAAELLEKLARAVDAAHRAGIIHRDLKPSNVLLAADGTPKIGDFGLAKLLGDDSACTVTGEVLGTPSYMAPEQAEGRARDVGPAADIYATGAILYQMLTGRPPFLGATPMETLRLVVSTDVVPPRRQRPGVPRDLETIALKCLEKEPSRRYSESAALADDLRRYLDGRPIAARPVGAAERALVWCRRRPAVAALTACRSRLGGLLFATGKTADALAAYRLARSDEEALAAAPEASNDARGDLADTITRIGNLLSDTGKPAEAEAHLRQALAIQQELADVNPAVTEFRGGLALRHKNLGW